MTQHKTDDDELIDTTTGASLEDATQQPLPARPAIDPAVAVVVELANQLQTIYENDQSKLRDANHTLKAAIQAPRNNDKH